MRILLRKKLKDKIIKSNVKYVNSSSPVMEGLFILSTLKIQRVNVRLILNIMVIDFIPSIQYILRNFEIKLQQVNETSFYFHI